jgi:hypothetical protein
LLDGLMASDVAFFDTGLEPVFVILICLHQRTIFSAVIKIELYR